MHPSHRWGLEFKQLVKLRSGSKFTPIRTVLAWGRWESELRRWGWRLDRMRLLGSGSLLWGKVYWLFLAHPRRNESCVLFPNTQMPLIP